MTKVETDLINLVRRRDENVSAETATIRELYFVQAKFDEEFRANAVSRADEDRFV